MNEVVIFCLERFFSVFAFAQYCLTTICFQTLFPLMVGLLVSTAHSYFLSYQILISASFRNVRFMVWFSWRLLVLVLSFSLLSFCSWFFSFLTTLYIFIISWADMKLYIYVYTFYMDCKFRSVIFPTYYKSFVISVNLDVNQFRPY